MSLRQQLHEAIQQGNFDMVEQCLNMGADINEYYYPFENSFGKGEKLTPLGEAILFMNLEMIKFLLSKGANTQVSKKFNGTFEYNISAVQLALDSYFYNNKKEKLKLLAVLLPTSSLDDPFIIPKPEQIGWLFLSEAILRADLGFIDREGYKSIFPSPKQLNEYLTLSHRPIGPIQLQAIFNLLDDTLPSFDWFDKEKVSEYKQVLETYRSTATQTNYSDPKKFIVGEAKATNPSEKSTNELSELNSLIKEQSKMLCEQGERITKLESKIADLSGQLSDKTAEKDQNSQPYSKISLFQGVR